MSEQQTRTRLVALALLAFALFNYPVLSLFDRDALVLGLPLLWLYVFVSWGVLIVLVGLTVRNR
ncbi:MAG TPA: hypothetical protein VLB29_15110 [Nocardioidaceae bacterium]|nr:hypothetical protein [Nocardioidaceae bacterium]